MIFKEKTNSSNSNSNNESDIKDKDIKPNDKTLLNIKRKLKNISISKTNTAPFDIKIRSKIINDLNNSIEDKNYIFKNKKNESDNNLNKDKNTLPIILKVLILISSRESTRVLKFS